VLPVRTSLLLIRVYGVFCRAFFFGRVGSNKLRIVSERARLYHVVHPPSALVGIVWFTLGGGGYEDRRDSNRYMKVGTSKKGTMINFGLNNRWSRAAG
jgi:hypothetical protein